MDHLHFMPVFVLTDYFWDKWKFAVSPVFSALCKTSGSEPPATTDALLNPRHACNEKRVWGGGGGVAVEADRGKDAKPPEVLYPL